MKLRICDNNIRLRLTRSEVELLASGQAIQVRTGLTPQPLVYRLSPSQKIDSVDVTFQDGELRVAVPASQIKSWATSDQVGIEAAISTNNGAELLTLLIEKDFKCLHGDSEHQEDCFTNPMAAME